MNQLDEEIRGYLAAAGIFLAALALGLAATFFPMPWSPLGQAQQDREPTPATAEPTIDLEQFDIPDGWQPGDDGTRIVIPRAPSTQT